MKYLLFIFLALSVACQQEKQQPKFTLPTDKEIEEVIEAVIEQDSLQFSNKIPIAMILKTHNLMFFTNDQLKQPPPPTAEFENYIEYNQLISNSKSIFNRKDSLYLLFQSENSRTFMLSTTFLNRYRSIEIKSNSKDFRLNNSFCMFSVPLFSQDNKSAYIAGVNHYGRDGKADYYYLNKVKGKWQILIKGNLWES